MEGDKRFREARMCREAEGPEGRQRAGTEREKRPTFFAAAENENN